MKRFQLITLLLVVFLTHNIAYASNDHDHAAEKQHAHKHDESKKSQKLHHNDDDRHDDQSDDKHDHNNEHKDN